MTDELHQAIDRALTDHAFKIAAAREQACEAMLQRDEGGVLGIQHNDGSVEFFVTDLVPYGRIDVWSEPLSGPFPFPLPAKEVEDDGSGPDGPG